MEEMMAPATAPGARPVLHLHIGTPKTGTSAIQAFLPLNRDAFREATGIHYAESESDVRALKGKPTAGNGAQIARHLRARKRESFDKAMRMLNRDLAGGHPRLLLSSEAFWGLPDDRFADLAAALKGQVEIKVLAYARPQVKHVESAYLQVLGNRGLKGDIVEFFDGQNRKFFIGTRLRFLQSLFGRDNVTVRKYDRKTLVGGDIIDDVLDVFGAAWGPQFKRPAEVNSSLDPEHYIYARMVAEAANGHAVGKRSMRDLRSQPLISALYDEASGIENLQVMDPATARRIADLYREDNELLDTLVGGSGFGFNADNEKAVAAIEAAADKKPTGFTRLELMLLNRLAQVEARLDELTGAGEGAEAGEDED